MKETTCDISLKRWLTDKEASIYVGLSRSKLQDARLKERTLPFSILEGKIIYDREKIDRWVDKYGKHYNTPIGSRTIKGSKP